MTLMEGYDALLLDLDGVVYTGPDAVPGVPAALATAHEAGVTVRYITNNASRTPSMVTDHLRGLGVGANPDEVVTSSQAAAVMLASRHAPGSGILVVGGAGLVDAISRAGLRPVRTLAEGPAAVVQGFGPNVGWEDLARATEAIHAGVPWLATNTDLTIPTERGTLPGNGTLVAAVRAAAGIDPEVAGKPEPGIFRAAMDASGARRGLMIGDRLDTDILGGNRAGIDTLLVLSGVHGIRDAALAAPASRPTYLGASVASVHAPAHPIAGETPAAPGDWAVRGDARARITSSGVEREGRGLDAATAVIAAAWSTIDAGGTVDRNDVPEYQDLT